MVIHDHTANFNHVLKWCKYFFKQGTSMFADRFHELLFYNEIVTVLTGNTVELLCLALDRVTVKSWTFLWHRLRLPHYNAYRQCLISVVAVVCVHLTIPIRNHSSEFRSGVAREGAENNVSTSNAHVSRATCCELQVGRACFLKLRSINRNKYFPRIKCFLQWIIKSN
jgi:hypothetical protein